MTAKKKTSVVWAPQAGPQEALITCPYPLIGFGGARGGGKTDGVLGMFGLKQKLYKQNFNAVFFRREMPQADDLIERAMQLYVPLGATFQAQKRQFTFPDGGRLRFRPLYNDADAAKYQGQNLSDAAVEEAGNYPDPAPIWKLFGALRGGAIDQPIQLILTFNPGGAGHYWLREKFVKPAPLGMKRLEWKLDTGDNIPYVYIPSRITDNQILLEKDPQYIQRLHMVGSAELVRAWLEGDFEIHAGSYFPEFGQKHIVAPFPIPQHWQRYLAFDWGFRSPYCAVWGAISSGKDDSGREVPYPKNSIIIYRELMAKGQDNVTIGENIGQRCSGETISRAVADPSIFSNEGGPSIHDQIKPGLIKHRVPIFQRGDNDRLSGWSQIRQRLQENMIFFFSTCNYLLDTLPALQVCPKRPEDVDTTGEDHGADALRYLCKERLLESTYKKTDEPIQKGLLKVQQYVQQVRAEARRARL